MIRKFLLATAFATGAALGAAAEPADNPDEDCDDIMEELKELTDKVVADKNNARTPLAVCAATGQVLGIVKASREVVAECYGEGKKRTDLLATFDKAVTDIEATVSSTCK